MEQDGPTACIILVEYYELKRSLIQKASNISRGDALHPMISKMLERVDKYMKEASKCHTILMATFFHPGFRLRGIENFFGSNSDEVMRTKQILKKLFEERKTKLQEQNGFKESQENWQVTHSKPIKNIYALFDLQFNESSSDEIDCYVRGLDSKSNQTELEPDDPRISLSWWKVSDIC